MRILSGIGPRLRAWVAASPALAALQDDRDPARSRRARAAIVALCLAAHLGFLLLLRTPGVSRPPQAPARPIEISFVERDTRAEESLLPMPQRARRAPRSLRVVRIDPPLTHTSTRDSALDAVVPQALPSGSDLLHRLPAFVDGMHDDSKIGIRDPLRPIRARLPGSEVAIVAGIKLRREITPQDVVKSVGALLFGGGYEPCPDLLGKMHDATITNPASYSDAERRDLMESERRCRHR